MCCVPFLCILPLTFCFMTCFRGVEMQHRSFGKCWLDVAKGLALFQELRMNKMVPRLVLESWLCVFVECTFSTMDGKRTEKPRVGSKKWGGVSDRQGTGTKAVCWATGEALNTMPWQRSELHPWWLYCCSFISASPLLYCSHTGARRRRRQWIREWPLGILEMGFTRYIGT